MEGADADLVPLLPLKPLLLEGRASASRANCGLCRRALACLGGSWPSCNVDASRFVMDESVGFAAVILDSYGHVLRSSTGRMEGLIEPLLAEAIAIRESLSWLKSLHLDRVVIESDCLMVVEALPVSFNNNNLVTSFMIACGYDHLLHLCSSVGLILLLLYIIRMRDLERGAAR
ncbi:hypothetical protein Gogos_016582, partial [Gossypium gossypioides]|nr:hypothetical protein [Gossypium gossypioides]